MIHKRVTNNVTSVTSSIAAALGSNGTPGYHMLVPKADVVHTCTAPALPSCLNIAAIRCGPIFRIICLFFGSPATAQRMTQPDRSHAPTSAMQEAVAEAQLSGFTYLQFAT
jgi:hypothetical protein